MWIRISLAPLWVRVLAFVGMSALWAGLFVAIQWFEDGTVEPSLIATIVVGVSTAAVWSAVAVSQIKQRYGRVLDNIDLPATQAAALKAALGGPIPTDPVVRHIAATIATIRAQTMRKQTRGRIIANSLAVALMSAVTIWALADGSPRRALLTGMFALWLCGVGVQTHWAHRRALHRQVLLAGHPEMLPPR
jgi:hypothetical protein